MLMWCLVSGVEMITMGLLWVLSPDLKSDQSQLVGDCLELTDLTKSEMCPWLVLHCSLCQLCLLLCVFQSSNSRDVVRPTTLRHFCLVRGFISS